MRNNFKTRVHQTVNQLEKPDRYTDRRLLSGLVSEWYTDRFSYRTGPVTPKIAVYRPVYREMVNTIQNPK
jgi:hypothetical protein